MKRRTVSGRQTLAIDPGLQGLGVAYWRSVDIAPDWVEVIGPTKGEWIDRAGRMARRVRELLRQEGHWKQTTVVCELMEMHMSARAQMMWRAGDFQRTLVLIGMIAQAVSPCHVVLVKPSEWKGQMPKSVTETRIRKQLGCGTCPQLKGMKSHGWDAIGIGLWARGRF